MFVSVSEARCHVMNCEAFPVRELQRWSQMFTESLQAFVRIDAELDHDLEPEGGEARLAHQ